MDARDLLEYQLGVSGNVIQETIQDIPAEAWTAIAHAGANPPGFIAWHMAATIDWALHTWLRGLPDVRKTIGLPGIDPPCGPFAMSAGGAAAIARTVTPGDVAAYADAVVASGLEWMRSLSPTDIEAVHDTRAHTAGVPDTHKTQAYLEEIADMYDYPVWRIIGGPCFGHVREHGGEVHALIAMLSAR